MRKAPRRCAVVGAVLLVAMCGCSGADGDGHSDATPASTPTTDLSPTAQAPGSVLTVADASPIDAAVERVATIPGIADDGRWQNLQAVMPDGSVVLALFESPSEEKLTDQELLISQPDAPSQGIGIDVSDPGPPTQNYGTVTSGLYVAWMTSTSTRIDSWPWTLKVHDLKSGTTTEVTRSSKIDGRDPSDVPGSTGPAIVGDRVAWAEVHGTPRQQRVDVMECQIEKCRPSVVARDSGLPAATESALYFAKPYEFGFPKPKDAFTIQRVDAKSGRQTTVATLGRDRNALPTGLAASDTVVAWTHRQRNRGAITIQDTDTGKQVAVFSRANGIFGYPVATDRFVAWAEASGTSPDQVGGYLYDLRHEQLYEMGDTSGLYSISASGDFVTWQEGGATRTSPANTVVARLRR